MRTPRIVAAALAAVLLAACGSSAAKPAATSAPVTSAAATTSTAASTTGAPATTASTSAATTAAPATEAPTTVAETTTTATPLPTEIPAGTTLRIGDQLSYLQTALALSGQDKGFPYQIDWAAFVGGPPMLQAFQAGSLDAGFVGSTPLIFAQAAQQDITAIATWVVKGGTYGLVTKPGETSIQGWADLKGKKVAFQKSTAAEAALLQALDKVGLQEGDIEPVDLPITQISAALQSGAADAGLIVEPLTSVYLAANPTARVVLKADELTDRSQFLIATSGALKDDAKVAALADFITRLVKAYTYTSAHPDEVAQAVYVKQYGLTPERAAQVAKENGGSSFATLPGDVLPVQQHLADLFQAAGDIPGKIDVSAEFDSRFNGVVTKAQGG